MADKTRKGRSSARAAGAKQETGAKAQPYVVLARKYRPSVFDDLIGQDALVVTLTNAFAAGRIAQAYMLTGVRGVGKTTTARILARALNFARDGDNGGPTTELPREERAYGQHCADIMESRHPDVIEMDAASNTGVDNIREIIESARYKPLIARYKVFIIDEVHMLSKGAFNALLKTLEEPPEHVKFIFATTEIRKVPVTVLSRCQRFDLRRVDIDELISHFKLIVEKEGANAEEDALRLISRAAEGSVRDGLSILDQAIAFQQGDVRLAGVRDMLGLADRGRVFDLLEHVLSGRVTESLEQLNALHRDGSEPARILSDLAEAVHLVTRAKVIDGQVTLDGVSADEQKRARSIADSVSIPLTARAWQMLLKGVEETARAPMPLAAAEMVLIRMCFIADLPTPDEVIRMLGDGAPSSPGGREGKTGAQKHETTAVKAQARAPVAASSAYAIHSSSEPDVRAGLDDDTTQTAAAPFAESAFESDGVADGALETAVPGQCSPNPRTFQDVVSLVGARRDARLKIHLEEHVSLVKFDLQSNAIDLHLLPGAPQTIANELREKLNEWTGTRWIVMLSKVPGAPPIAQSRRDAQEAEIARLKSDPVVQAALEVFPDATIVDVAPLESEPSGDDTEQGTG